MDLFCDTQAQNQQLQREKRQQQAVIGIKRKYGKNAILKGMNYLEGATARDRNRQIGGHKAWISIKIEIVKFAYSKWSSYAVKFGYAKWSCTFGAVMEFLKLLFQKQYFISCVSNTFTFSKGENFTTK